MNMPELIACRPLGEETPSPPQSHADVNVVIHSNVLLYQVQIQRHNKFKRSMEGIKYAVEESKDRRK